MQMDIGGRDHTHTLRRAHEQRDVDLALGLYDEHARVRLVGRGAPLDSPEVFSGKERIAEYLRETYLGGFTPRVGYSLSDVIEGDGRIVLNVAYVDANGTRVLLASETYVVSRGKIVDQLNIEAPQRSCEPPSAGPIAGVYGRLLELPVPVVLAVLWLLGVVLLLLGAAAVTAACSAAVWLLAAMAIP
jgi:hypothetical protein